MAAQFPAAVPVAGMMFAFTLEIHLSNHVSISVRLDYDSSPVERIAASVAERSTPGIDPSWLLGGVRQRPGVDGVARVIPMLSR